MEKRPPHLPKERGNKPSAKHLGILGLNLVVTFVMAMCATVITIAWISPEYIPETKIVTIMPKEPVDISGKTVDTFVIDQMMQRRVRVYQASAAVEQIGQFGTAGYIGDALLLSTDGWAVLHIPGVRTGAAFGWRAVDHKGEVLAIEKSVADPVAQLLYIKLATSDVRADVTFTPYKDLENTGLVWGLTKQQAQALQVVPKDMQLSGTVDLRAPRLAFMLAEDMPVGTLLINEQGAFVGFASKEGIIPAWFVSEQLSSVFGNTSFTYASLPVSAAVVLDTVVEEGRTSFQNGLYIHRVPTRASSSTLGLGDIIVQIDGNDVDAANAAFNIMRSVHDDVLTTIIRDGKRMQLQVPKAAFGT